MRAIDAVSLVKATYDNWSADDAGTLAAALAYFSAFALAPLLIIIIEIAATLLGGSAHDHVVRDAILKEVQPSLGASSTKAIGDILERTLNQKAAGTVATIIGWIVFIVGATGLFAAVENALDHIWHVREKSGGIVQTILVRIKSFGIIALFSLVLLLSLAANAAVNAFEHLIAASFPGRQYLFTGGQVIVSFIVVTIALAILYKYLPKATISWRDVLTGAAISAVLVIAGQYVIAFYLARVSTSSAYGAAGSFVAILIWLYYSAQIFLFGAEFTKTYASRYGSRAAQFVARPATRTG